MTITVDNPAFSQSADLPGGEEAAEFYSRYEPREVLGRGLVSVVRKCIHRATGDVFAVKIIDVGSEEGQKILDETKKEIEILKVLILSRFQPYSSQNLFIFMFGESQILIFSVCAPSPSTLCSPSYVSLHGGALCKNVGRASLICTH